MLPMLAEVGSFFPKVIAAKDAPCKQVILRASDVESAGFSGAEDMAAGWRAASLRCLAW